MVNRLLCNYRRFRYLTATFHAMRLVEVFSR